MQTATCRFCSDDLRLVNNAWVDETGNDYCPDDSADDEDLMPIHEPDLRTIMMSYEDMLMMPMVSRRVCHNTLPDATSRYRAFPSKRFTPPLAKDHLFK